MNNKKIFGILIGLFALVLWSVSCSQGTPQPGSSTPVISPTPGNNLSQPTVIPSKATPNLSQPPASKEATITELIPQGKMAQRNETNAVTIEAVLQSKLTVGSKELTFNVTLDTHSVDLDVYDLTTLATLRDSQGRQFKATSWQAPKGGHHRSGTLGIKSDQSLLQPDIKYIELVIRDVANVPERVLRWELRAAG
ncbi:MAG: hypothetical protein Q7R34_09900 [Dehalococcoidia bacterium]|nr:hypothetical protein [Dehalococcoidia bacterium]